jgi:hypothetical protein
MVKVSAVLIKYDRIVELGKVIDHLRGFEFIDDIVVHDNSVDNSIMYARYFATQKAKHNFIYVQDDDCIVENIAEIYEEFVRHKFNILVNGMKPERMLLYQESDTLMGWGAFFDRRWLWVLNIYLDHFGMDKLFFRECDRIFTTLLRCDKGRLTIPARIIDFPCAMSPKSLSLQSEHELSRQLAVKRCEGLLR